MKSKTILILGANSDIANAVAHEFAGQGYAIQLAARDTTSLDAAQKDLSLRYGVSVTTHEFDVLKTDLFHDFANGLPISPSVVLCAIGLMTDQGSSENSISEMQQVFETNFNGPAGILSVFANLFADRGFGTIVGISSVAGERGRASNYTYGAAKAGFTAFLSGLRNRLVKNNVHVVTILPGFVNTKMTSGLDLPQKLTAEPSEVGTVVFNAVRKKKNVVYVRPIWFVIMAIIRNIPEAIFKKLSI